MAGRMQQVKGKVNEAVGKAGAGGLKHRAAKKGKRRAPLRPSRARRSKLLARLGVRRRKRPDKHRGRATYE
jgi:hypothetical protein